MKKIFKMPVYVALGVMAATGFVSCDKENNNEITGLYTKEQALNDAVIPYVDNTVVSTYRSLADGALKLMNACNEAKEAFGTDNTKAQQKIDEAGNYWKESRKYWELSEAFLFGAASDYNIDPHIDSWPLDKAAMEQLLNNSGMMAAIGEGGGTYVSANLGYGLLGFHAIEYMLFQLDNTGYVSESRKVETLDRNGMIYMAAVAEDLCFQCIRLETSWAGMGNVTEEKQNILTEKELEPTFNYGQSMKNAGKGGSKYVNYTDAAQEIIQGCIDIADEVRGQKIGKPAKGSSEDDKNYIESPYSLNSITDFADNIRSISNAYQGINDTDKSISDYIASVNPEKDKAVKNAIDKAIAAILKMPEPFAKHATEKTSTDAMEAIDILITALEEVNKILTEN